MGPLTAGGKSTCPENFLVTLPAGAIILGKHPGIVAGYGSYNGAEKLWVLGLIYLLKNPTKLG